MTDNRDAQAKLLSLAVHEFRTPVAVVQGYLRMLLRHFGENLTDQQRKLLNESEKSCSSLAALLTELSDLAHLEDGRAALRHEPIPIFQLLADVAAGVQEGQDRGVRLEVRGTAREAVVWGDPDRLRAALASLLTATVRERVEGVVVAACGVSGPPPGDVAVIAIADDAAAEHLADQAAPTVGPFDEYRGGMGFRLPIAARVIAAHGGCVSSPEAARGRLAIVLSLPLATESEKAV